MAKLTIQVTVTYEEDLTDWPEGTIEENILEAAVEGDYLMTLLAEGRASVEARVIRSPGEEVEIAE